MQSSARPARPPRHRVAARWLVAAALVVAAAACTDRPTEPVAPRSARVGFEDKEGNPLLVVGSSVRGVARLEVAVESDGMDEPAQFEFKNERPADDEAWGGVPVPRGAKALLTVNGYDAEGRERFAGQLTIVADGDVVRQVREPVKLTDPKEAEASAGEWPEAPVVYAGSHRVAFESRGVDEKSGALTLAAWAHDAGGERLPISAEEVKLWLTQDVGRLEIVHDDRELREIVVGWYAPTSEKLPIPNLPRVVLCTYEELCGAWVIPAPPPPPPVSYLKVVAHDSHTCALRTSGLAMCWGTEVAGELAGGPANNLLAPYAFQDIDTHVDHGCGVTTAGAVLCWGSGSWNQLGYPLPAGVPFDEHPAPISPANLSGATFKAVTTGRRHSCGLAVDGTAWCWGANDYGQVGDGSAGYFVSRPPTRVAYPEAFTQVDAGDDHTCAITVTQAVVCWGRDVEHQTGDAPEVDVNPKDCYLGGAGPGYVYVPCRKNPARVGTDQFVSVSADGATTCAIRIDRKGLCWGQAIPGSAMTGTTASPAPMPGGTYFALTVGQAHACLSNTWGAVATSGNALCWGANDHAQLGGGSPSGTPATVPSTLRLSSIGIGQGYTCGISQYQSSLLCWGRSGLHLGFPSTGDATSPTAVTVF